MEIMNEIQDIIEIKPTDELLELRRRNEQRANEIKTLMGDKWVLHPSNHVQRKQNKPSILGGRNIGAQ